MSLHRFESFVPKNLSDRPERLRAIKEKELQMTVEVAKGLKKRTEKFKGLKSEDKVEQFFLDMFTDCQIKINPQHPRVVLFFEKGNQFGNGKYLADYDLSNETFYVSTSNFFAIIEREHDLSYGNTELKVAECVAKYLGLKDFDIDQAWGRYVSNFDSQYCYMISV